MSPSACEDVSGAHRRLSPFLSVHGGIRNSPCRQAHKHYVFVQLRRRCCCRGIRRIRPKMSPSACERCSQASVPIFVRAWLIASRKKIPDHESDPESDFFMLWNGRGKQRPDPENSSACHPKEEMLIKRAQPCPNAYILCRHESSCCRRRSLQQFSER